MEIQFEESEIFPKLSTALAIRIIFPIGKVILIVKVPFDKVVAISVVPL